MITTLVKQYGARPSIYALRSGNHIRSVTRGNSNVIEKISKASPPLIDGVVYPYGVSQFIGGRQYMEDRNLVIPKIKGNSKTSLYSVFDGHSGTFSCNYCLATFPSYIERSSHDPLTDPEGNLMDVFRRVDREIVSSSTGRGFGSGTTAVAALINDNKITVANAGDSRAILVTKNGEAIPLSRDHKPNRRDELERITKLGGIVVHWGVWRVEGILAVSRGIGDSMLKKYVIPDPEFMHHTITSEDAHIVIATDGLWDVVNNQEAARLAMLDTSAQASAERLCQEAYIRHSEDNITVIVIDLQPRKQKASGN